MVKKPERLWIKILCLALFVGLLAIWLYFDLPCLPRTLTGIPCVTCGMTRSWLAALRLDLKAAFLQHPMFWAVPLWILYLLYDGRLFPNLRCDRWVLTLTVLGTFLIWVARLFGFLGGLSPL